MAACAGGDEGEAVVYDLARDRAQSWPVAASPYWIALAADGEGLWLGPSDRPQVELLDLDTGQTARTLPTRTGYPGAASRRALVFVEGPQAFTVHDPATGERVGFDGAARAQERIGRVDWTPDGASILGIGSADGCVHLFAADSGERSSLRFHKELASARGVAVSPDGGRMALLSGPLEVFALESGARILQLDGSEIP